MENSVAPGCRCGLVMPAQGCERRLEQQLGGAGRPTPLRFHLFDALEEAADVDQRAGEFGADGIERLVHSDAGGEGRIGEISDAVISAAWAAGDRCLPAGATAPHELSPAIVRAHALYGLELLS